MIWLYACAGPSGPAAPEDSAAPAAEAPLHFRWPLLEPEKFYQTTGADHDPEVHDAGIEAGICTNYDGRGFPWCYDEHDGSDYLLAGGFDTMDEGSATIVAAASGVVVETHDGEYDRCHATLEGVDCDGHPMVGNHVIVEHEGGWLTRYWHMKTDSVRVAVGQEVACGDALGLVGSSGLSSAPHLHFEVNSPALDWIDPYAGLNSQPESWWVDQGDAEGFPSMECEG